MTQKIAILDMNNNKPNQGLKSIENLVEQFIKQKNNSYSFTTFNVRGNNEMPALNDFDLFISSGGPGSPFTQNEPWEQPFYDFLDAIYTHNLENENKKYLFLICHSFQIACMHWRIGTVCKRYSYSFGIMPTHKTQAGKKEVLYKDLPDPFFVVDSREYQVITPDYDEIDQMGAKIVSLEKIRPHIELERAVMSIRFSDEIFGTQFHPEANPEGMQKFFLQADKKKHIIETYGEKKYYDTIDKIDDPDKIVLTEKAILPVFMENAFKNIEQQTITT